MKKYSQRFRELFDNWNLDIGSDEAQKRTLDELFIEIDERLIKLEKMVKKRIIK